MHYLNRLEGIKRAKRVLRIWDQCEGWNSCHGHHEYQDELSSKHPSATWPKLMIRTRKLCSGSCCGNPRRIEGPTRQELRAADDIRQQLRELEFEEVA